MWPKSRHKKPKHLLDLFGNGSLIKLTYLNFLSLIPKERILVVTLREYADLTKAELSGLPEENIICEPMAKNTAMAMGTAAAYVRKRDEEAVIIHEAADHLYDDVRKLHATASSALEAAAAGDYIVAIGIRPTFPHTGLGYIRIGEPMDGFNGGWGRRKFVFIGKGFKEKPDLTTAQTFLASGKYLWNANLYCWSAKTIFQALETYSPQIYRAVNKIYQAVGTSEEKGVVETVYHQVGSPSSIDYEVSEKAKNIIVVPGDFGWSDVGDWKVVYETQEKDRAGNVVSGAKDNCIMVDTYDCLVEGNGRLIATLGVKDLVVIDTPDALLICDKNRSQDVKKIIEKLKELKKGDIL